VDKDEEINENNKTGYHDDLEGDDSQQFLTVEKIQQLAETLHLN
jgi:hypothetical protein